MSDEAREAALAHFGVRGMKWGVRKARTSDSGGGGPSKQGSTPTHKLSADDVAVIQRRRNLGDAVLKAAIATMGGATVAVLAGPVVGSAAAAATKFALDETRLIKPHPSGH